MGQTQYNTTKSDNSNFAEEMRHELVLLTALGIHDCAKCARRFTQEEIQAS